MRFAIFLASPALQVAAVLFVVGLTDRAAAENTVPTIGYFETKSIPLDGYDAPAISNHWLWAQADGRFGRGILNLEDIRDGAAATRQGSVVVEVDGEEVVSDGLVDWRPNQIVRRASVDGLRFVGTVRTATKQYALLSRLKVTNTTDQPKRVTLRFRFAAHTPLVAFVDTHSATSAAPATKPMEFPDAELAAGETRSFRVIHVVRGNEDQLKSLVEKFDHAWDESDRYWNDLLSDAFTPGHGRYLSGGVPNHVYESDALTRLYRFGVVSALMLLKNDPDRRLPVNWYCTSMPDASYSTECYIWDVGYASATLAQLDPEALATIIERWAEAGVHQRMCVPYHKGPSVCGPRFYAASGSLFTWSVANYLKETDDFAFLDRTVAGKSIWEHLLSIDAWHSGRLQWNGLAHYGEERNLFDDRTIPGYEHFVAGPNAAAVWIKRQLAIWAQNIRGESELATRLRCQADRLAAAVIDNLYQSDGEYAGTFRQRHVDGSIGRNRHSWDFMNAGAFLADDLSVDQRKQMRDWFVSHLVKPSSNAIWIVSQDPRDGNNGPHQMEHNGRGAYPAWPFHAAWALSELGYPEDARALIKQVAPIVRFGAISQGNEVNGRRCRSGWVSIAGASLSTIVQEQFEAEP